VGIPCKNPLYFRRDMSGKKSKKNKNNRHKVLSQRVKAIMRKNNIDPLAFNFNMQTAKRAFKAGTIAVLLLMCASMAYADKLIIPFDCYPKEIQTQFAETGRKLDLSGNDRTRESWGFIVNEGSQFTIYTYKSASQEDFTVMMNIIQGA